MSQISLRDLGHVPCTPNNHQYSVLSLESGRADPAVGVGSQALPIPADECGAESGESGELLRDGGIPLSVVYVGRRTQQSRKANVISHNLSVAHRGFATTCRTNIPTNYN